MLASKVTEDNYLKFYRQIYRQQFFTVDQLIQLNKWPNSHFVIVDCCGWHYKKLFPAANITSVETNFSVNQYKLSQDMYDDTFIYNASAQEAHWPKLAVDNPTLIFDRSNFLRYLTVDNFNRILQGAADNFKPRRIILRVDPSFIDDNRLTDRIHNLHNIQVGGFVVEYFVYIPDKKHLEIIFKANNE